MNRQDRIKKLLKPSNLLILCTATIIYLTIFIFQIIALSSKSYVLTKSDLFPIDSVRMLSRAYKGGPKTTTGIYFDDETYKTFWITGSRYLAIPDTDISKLYDTLRYSDLTMRVYTNKAGYENYFDKKNKDKIEVYGIQIGGKEYIPLDKVNKDERKGRISLLIFFTISYCILNSFCSCIADEQKRTTGGFLIGWQMEEQSQISITATSTKLNRITERKRVRRNCR